MQRVDGIRDESGDLFMELLPIGGLLLIVVSMFIAFSRRSSTDDILEQAYVIKGLALMFFAVGAFMVGRWLIGVAFVDMLDVGYMTSGGWVFASPLILVFLFGISRRRKI